MTKELNIYQKLSIMQERIKVNKGNNNKFADFKYRTIQDILSELKPMLKELELVLTFKNGTLQDDKYSLNMVLLDINKPTENRIDESGEIYIDRTKKQMDLSQKCLSAKTFLKKSLLEDLLLISEDDDPDGHDNTPEPRNSNTSNPIMDTKEAKNTTKPVSEDEKNEAELRAKVQNILFFAANKDKSKMYDLLEAETEFVSKRDNKKVPGLRDFKRLRNGRLKTTYGIICKKYPEATKLVTDKMKGDN